MVPRAKRSVAGIPAGWRGAASLFAQRLVTALGGDYAPTRRSAAIPAGRSRCAGRRRAHADRFGRATFRQAGRAKGRCSRSVPHAGVVFVRTRRELSRGHVESSHRMERVFADQSLFGIRLHLVAHRERTVGRAAQRIAGGRCRRGAGRSPLVRVIAEFRVAFALALSLHAEARGRAAHRVRQLRAGL